MRRRVVASIGPTPCKFADRIVVVLELSLCDFSAETHVLFCLLVALLSYCYDVSSGGTLVTAEPFMGGAVELAGRLCAGTLSIDKASILENLSVGYSGITAQLTGAASIVNPFLEPASERLSVLLENDLIATVEPTVRPVIEAQLEDRTLFAPAKLLPIQARLVRNAAVRRIENFYTATAQFLGLVGGEDGNDEGTR